MQRESQLLLLFPCHCPCMSILLWILLLLCTSGSLPFHFHLCTWVVNNAASSPLSICKLQIDLESSPRANIVVTLTIGTEKTWFIHNSINSDNCPLIQRLLPILSSVSSIRNTIDSNKICSGNSDPSFIESWKQRSLTLNNSTGNNFSCYVYNV